MSMISPSTALSADCSSYAKDQAILAAAVAILRELQPLTGRHRYVFPGARDRDRPMSNNTVRGALQRLGYTGEEMTAHGFRHMASTRLNEMSRWNPDAIEAALSHKMPGVRGVYAGRAQYLDERKRMMQAWADYLDGLRAGGDVVADDPAGDAHAGVLRRCAADSGR